MLHRAKATLNKLLKYTPAAKERGLRGTATLSLRSPLAKRYAK